MKNENVPDLEKKNVLCKTLEWNKTYNLNKKLFSKVKYDTFHWCYFYTSFMIFTAYSKDLALIKILLIYSYFLLKFRHFSLIRLKPTSLIFEEIHVCCVCIPSTYFLIKYRLCKTFLHRLLISVIFCNICRCVIFKTKLKDF